LPNLEPDFRLRSAVRQLCKWRAVWGLAKFRKYLSDKNLDTNLLLDFQDQWLKGNKGEYGDWRV